MSNCFFSKKIVLNVIVILDRFNTTLSQQIKIFESTQNTSQFSQILNTLSPELFYFIDHIKTWPQKIKTAKEHKTLLLLEQHMEHAKSLVQKATLMVKEFN